MSLIKKDSITLWTRNGNCEIQLLYGDICQLAVEEKVDLVMVSAFPGDYAAVQGTCIGALRKNLGISVEQLSREKELDLRTHFSCWLSKLLPDHMPYERLLCFERRRTSGMTMAQQISEMFRVFVPVFNNQDTTIITPLLATGNQGYNKIAVLYSMVDGAANWISAGLPLRCLKIVLYEGNNTEINKTFTKLKVVWETRNLKSKGQVFKHKYDVYISFSAADETWVNVIKSKMAVMRSNVSIFSEIRTFDKDEVWQDDIFKIMITCRKIIAILTPAYVSSSECLEQFNMAMCCNRLTSSEMLAPFYIQTINVMPIYMGLIQYVDCRVRIEGDSSEKKIETACSGLLSWIQKLNESTSDIACTTPGYQTQTSNEDKFNYDIFISYSHKNPKEAEALLHTFTSINPEMRVFYDKSELTTGSLWQKTLYQCLDNAKCIIALMSATYCSSSVCQEEYNIALARFLSKDENIQFLPICISDVEEIPSWYGQVKMLDARGDKFSTVTHNVAAAVIDWLTSGTNYPLLFSRPEKNRYNIDAVLKQIREEKTRNVYTVKTRNFQRKITSEDDVDCEGYNIAFSYARDSIFCAVCLSHLLQKRVPEIDISFISDDGHDRMNELEKARTIVIFLSQEFIKSEHHMQELYMTLCRHRAAQDDSILYVIRTTDLPPKPMFVHLLPCQVDFTDSIWTDFERYFFKQMGKCGLRHVVTSTMQEFHGTYSCSYGNMFALSKAVDDILDSWKNTRSPEMLSAQICIQNVLKVEMETDEEKLPLLSKKYSLQEYIMKGSLHFSAQKEVTEMEVSLEDNPLANNTEGTAPDGEPHKPLCDTDNFDIHLEQVVSPQIQSKKINSDMNENININSETQTLQIETQKNGNSHIGVHIETKRYTELQTPNNNEKEYNKKPTEILTEEDCGRHGLDKMETIAAPVSLEPIDVAIGAKHDDNTRIVLKEESGTEDMKNDRTSFSAQNATSKSCHIL